ncbi:DNA-binding protein [Methylomonas albis]|uniref:DNA-binding protein n=1 Tax=Methylomonas albis TaxID=1854563 RepID=A0ABR9D3Y7_9GAMM|nr:DNA-binding protein [Methylomonas albis]MBD9357501.1 DNA-binding protein [Methylomonas albis]
MKTLRERLLEVIDFKGETPKTLEEKTGVDRAKWSNIKRKDPIRATEEHLEAVFKLWPEYALWIATETTNPEAGQISPELEESRQKLGRAG